MTPDERREAYVLILAAKLDLAMASKHETQASLARKMDTNRATVNRMLSGSDAYLSTWLDAFAALGYDVVLVERERDVA